MVSTAHAWSTGATSALTGYVLGVLPGAPGYATLTVAPHPGNLAWARGRVPTPHGPVDVSWQRHRCGGFQLQVALPAGVRATLVWGHTRVTAGHRGTYGIGAEGSCAANRGKP
jgi:alpha-L-rhamnosidase